MLAYLIGSGKPLSFERDRSVCLTIDFYWGA